MKAIQVKTEKRGECDVVVSHKPGRNGYVVICRDGIPNQYLHRIICEQKHGPLGDFDATHSCDNRNCVNPDHIRPGTRKQNMNEAVDRKRLRVGPNPKIQGENHGEHKLTDGEVLAILAAPGSQRPIAKRFGVSQVLVSLIKRRKVWRHLIGV